jgi:hypothetical protein
MLKATSFRGAASRFEARSEAIGSQSELPAGPSGSSGWIFVRAFEQLRGLERAFFGIVTPEAARFAVGLSAPWPDLAHCRTALHPSVCSRQKLICEIEK